MSNYYLNNDLSKGDRVKQQGENRASGTVVGFGYDDVTGHKRLIVKWDSTGISVLVPMGYLLKA